MDRSNNPAGLPVSAEPATETARREISPSANIRVLASPGLCARESNPYTWLLYSHMDCEVLDFSLRHALRGGYDVLHLHWPDNVLNVSPTASKAALRLLARFAVVDYLRARGTKLFWTVHNVHSHEGRHPRIEKWFWPRFVRRLDGYIALTEGGQADALNRFPELRSVPGFVIRHGHYRDEYPQKSAAESRAALGLPGNAKVVLFFGKIRAYKNVPLLIQTFRQLSDPELILQIAGKPPDLATREAVIACASGDARVRVEMAHIPSKTAPLYFGSADLVVLPYREFLNSGVALLALSLDRPILVPNRGALAELAAEVGPDWVRTYDGELRSEELEEAVRWARTQSRGGRAPIDHLDWKTLGAQTLNAYTSVVGRRRHCMSRLPA